ncbi:MAG: bacteriohopanetetrol glucosamine biosynthesis glycosyltransferase HpnI [Bryobacterales bacterium]|nr:bacteriohopanetetrol glucosamine biosynthesis glycosyltransferase HpnI [Bryobacteraceae bacterium]MDW8129639.1 bacteriohopanetetrol glucosamine biosynthesis glycosyltransferase HpnI [Bryobacterales bacterium]
MTLLVACLAAAAAAYQFLAWLAVLAFLRRPAAIPRELPRVSILKPVYGLDPHFYEAVESHAILDYPDYEILFGLSDPADPARPLLEKLCAAYPHRPMRIIVASHRAPNPKVGVLIELARQARHPVLVVNDSDIAVPRDYLRRLVAALEEPGVGLATCLYRGEGQGLAGRFEALAIATDFVPGVLVAPRLGVSEFALGATMAFRATDLARAGGFEAIADYLADDYQLGRRMRALGLRVTMAPLVVVTFLPNKGWRQAWQHQVRWARTVRACRRGGYLGMPVTWATLWVAALAACGWSLAALGLLALRLMTAFTVASRVLRMPLGVPDLVLVPLRDLWGVAIWIAGLTGRRVTWRGRSLKIAPDGRIRHTPDLAPVDQ